MGGQQIPGKYIRFDPYKDMYNDPSQCRTNRKKHLLNRNKEEANASWG